MEDSKKYILAKEMLIAAINSDAFSDEIKIAVQQSNSQALAKKITSFLQPAIENLTVGTTVSSTPIIDEDDDDDCQKINYPESFFD